MAGIDATRAAAGGPGRVTRPRAAPALARLTARLVRHGTLWMALAVASYLVIEVVGYERTYPDGASRGRLDIFQDNPASRMLQGIPHDIDEPGGFTAWDAGWVLAAIVGIWAILTVSRLLRGEEESERAELVLAAPVRAGRAVLVQLLVVMAAIAVVGAAAAIALAAAGTGPAGSVLFALGIAGIAALFAGVTAIAAQLFEMRRRAVGASVAVLGGFFLLRMVANSGDARGWLRWLIPLGWLDELRPYGDVRWATVALLAGVPVPLCAIAVRLRGRRDTGGALLTGSDRRPARTGLLGGPARFAWRGARGVFTAWLAGTVAYALMIGSMVKTATEFVAQDPGYRKMIETLGLDVSRITEAFVGMMAILLGLMIVLYACWRIGAARTEESSQRAEHILTRPLTRRRWLAGHILVTLAASAALTIACGLAMWAGAAMTRADVGAGDALGAALNTLPLVMFFTGLAVLAYGLLPRPATAIAVTLAVVTYVMELMGPALRFPAWLMDVSPFHHVPPVPAEPFAPWPAVALTVLGLLAAGLGVVFFERRDLAGD